MYALSIKTNSNVCFIYRDKFKCMVYLKRQIQMYGLSKETNSNVWFI